MNRKRGHAHLVLWATFVAFVSYAILVEPLWVEVTQHTLGTKRGRDRIRVVQLSDLHLHEIGRTEVNTIEAVSRMVPDVILLTGDIADRPQSLPILDEYLAKLDAPIMVAVLGNWEYWGAVDQIELRKVYARHGVKLLINECARISVRNQILWVAGLDDSTAGSPDFRKIDSICLGHNDGFVLIQHSPGYFENISPPITELPKSMLALSGHTHGGQVSLFGLALWTPPGSGTFNRGWYETSWGRLYVSRGVGTSMAKIRFASRPEVAVFDLE